ncbi:MAG: rhomboid family intramembrane serine protease [Bacteroidales bacterium]|nr:rhomboid family intramembrane serine protease [Bacteroidales bacterium]
MTVWEGIKDSFKEGSALIKLIYINVGVWLVVSITYILLFLFSVPDPSGKILVWLAVPAYLPSLLTHPWTVFTYMFTHQGFLHILFNLLWLYWFGIIFLQYFDPKKLVGVYLLGGLSGALLYILVFNLFPAFHQVLPYSMAIGASASIMAIIVATAVYVPDYTVYIFLIGPVKIKWVALVAFILTTLVDFPTNTGGKLAHLGGALYGYFFTVQYRRGKDMTRSFNQRLDTFFSWFKPRKKKLHVKYRKPADDFEYNRQKAEEQKEIDRILDKISKGGYDSLTKKEKETLFRMSNKH